MTLSSEYNKEKNIETRICQPLYILKPKFSFCDYFVISFVVSLFVVPPITLGIATLLYYKVFVLMKSIYYVIIALAIFFIVLLVVAILLRQYQVRTEYLIYPDKVEKVYRSTKSYVLKAKLVFTPNTIIKVSQTLGQKLSKTGTILLDNSASVFTSDPPYTSSLRLVSVTNPYRVAEEVKHLILKIGDQGLCSKEK